jgi:glycosyltransferase involved in cell wall biosynthesis
MAGQVSFLKITIVTPSYNQGNYLEETIRSILNQDYPNLEYFIVDGGSKDQSVDIIKKYESQLDKWVSEPDKGQTDAINKGLNWASGDVFTWINSDDQLTENALFKANEIFQRNPEIELIHGKTILINGKEIIKGANEKQLPSQYLSGMAFPQPSSFFRTRLIQQYSMKLDESLHYGMDFDLFIRLFLVGEFMCTEEVFSRYLIHPESKTSQTNVGFAKDWALVYSRFLATVERKDLIYLLQTMGLYQDDGVRYKIDRHLSDDLMEESFKLFLAQQAHFYYQDLDISMAKMISRTFKERFPASVEAHEMDRISFRSSIPMARWILPLFRG